MVKRTAIDIGLGLVLAVAGQFAQLVAAMVLPLLGLPHPYDMAPDDGTIPPALLDQINAQFLIAATFMLLLSLGVGLLRKLRGAVDGVGSGAIWALVVGLSQALLGLGEGVVPVMGLTGTWVYLAAVMIGPVLAGVLGSRRPPR